MHDTYISASELAEYVYCQCCWMDKLEGLQKETLEMEKGKSAHDSIYRWVFLFLRARLAIIFLILVSAIIFLAQFILVFIYHTSLW